jgi:hypothetical protein
MSQPSPPDRRRRRDGAVDGRTQQKRNQGVTEIVEMPNRGHALVIDSGWREVADPALTFVQRFATAGKATVAAEPAAVAV